MTAAILVALITMMVSAAVAGAITLITCTGTNPCEGTKWVDEIDDSDGDDVIYAYAGDDDIDSYNGGNDTVYAGDGDDEISGDQPREIYGEEGDDYIYSDGQRVLVS
jgi:Ca2+-binding RTX toxin-like protein